MAETYAAEGEEEDRNLNGRDGDISPLASWGPALLAR